MLARKCPAGESGGAMSGASRATGSAEDMRIVAQTQQFVKLWADGLCEPVNPGGFACWGFYAVDAYGQRIGEGRGCLGHGPGMTNNSAEYQAAIEALRWAAGEGLRGAWADASRRARP